MYNTAVIEEVNQLTTRALNDFLSRRRARRAVVVPAVAGAGKSHLVGTGVGAARRDGWRVAVCAPTNEQVYSLVHLLATRYPREQITFVPAQKAQLPTPTAQLPNVLVRQAAQVHDAGIVVGTFDKLGDAFTRGDLAVVDGLLADESFQADAARYFAVAGLAPTHLLVGDWGQILPFSTVDTDRWRGLPEDPLQTAVGVLLRNHPATPVYRLPATRRLAPRAIPIARAFYPGHNFDAAVLPDVRQIKLLPGIAQDHRTRVLDQALSFATRAGWAHVELPDSPVLTADPETIDLIVDLIRRLRDRAPEVRCERTPQWQALAPERIAVGVSHNDQRDHLRLALDAVGFSGIVVNTANKLQGAELDLTIIWHPLAGMPDANGFHLDPGRLYVLLKRHRHACIVVGRAGDRELLDGVPPTTPAYLGWDPDPVLDGWEIHQTIFARLEPHRIAA